MSDSEIDPLPTHALDPRVIGAWRVSSAIGWIVLLAIAFVAAAFAWQAGVPGVLVFGVLIVLVILAIVNVTVVPKIRWQQWRFDVNATEVDLAYGLVTRTRARIPIARVQHVDTRRSAIDRHFGIATVLLYTAAGGHEIPGLSLNDAAAVRNRIAHLANVRDDV